MKPVYIILFSLLALSGTYILFHSFTQNRTVNSISNPTPTISLPTETPTPTPTITPIPTISVFPTDTPPTIIPTPKPSLKPNTNIQTIKAIYGPPFGFAPTEFTVKANVPVRLEVYASENGRGCMGSLMVPDFSNKIEGFVKDQTAVIEFTPTTPGEHYITCAMGIPHATLIVK